MEGSQATYDLETKLWNKYPEFLTEDEAIEIIAQLTRCHMEPGNQVMWSGVPRDWVQAWADRRGLQTLTTAMGPLMDGKHPLCRKTRKSPTEWSRYVTGASALFAEMIPKGHAVTVLLRPPPHRFNPLGQTTYQRFEEPVLKGHSSPSESSIYAVHITVHGAEDERYQIWPSDEMHDWVARRNKRTVRIKSRW